MALGQGKGKDRMRWVRFLLWFVLALGVLWGGYWFVGARALYNATQIWFENQRATGLMADNSAVSVAGFADRFDVTISDPHLADPVSGWGWQAPFVQILAMTWKPWHVIAAFPSDQVIQTPDGQEIALGSSRLMASILMHPTPALPLTRAVVEGEGLTLTSLTGWKIGVDRIVLAAERMATPANTLRLGADAATIRLPQAYAIVPDLGPSLSALHLDADVTLSQPIDRNLHDPHLAAFTLTRFHVAWGVLDLTAQGAVTPDSQGLASGKIDLSLKGWRSLPTAAVALGWVPPTNEQSLKRGLEFLAASSTDPEVITLPLKLENGQMILGFMPLGPAPRLR